LKTSSKARCRILPRRDDTMADLTFIGVTIVFFAVAWAYALGCDRL
jgi:hypothetical protein